MTILWTGPHQNRLKMGLNRPLTHVRTCIDMFIFSDDHLKWSNSNLTQSQPNLTLKKLVNDSLNLSCPLSNSKNSPVYYWIFSELRSAQINYEQFEQPMSRILREIKDTNHEKPSFLRCLRRKSFRLKCLMTWLLKIPFLCCYSKWDKHLKTQAIVFPIDEKFPDQLDANSFIYDRRSRVLILKFKNFDQEVFKIFELLKVSHIKPPFLQ